MFALISNLLLPSTGLLTPCLVKSASFVCAILHHRLVVYGVLVRHNLCFTETLCAKQIPLTYQFQISLKDKSDSVPKIHLLKGYLHL